MRKLSVLIITLLCTVCLGTHLFSKKNIQINAAGPASASYYQSGEKFKRTNKDTFLYKGLNWRIIYADNNTGRGYIMSENVMNVFGCSLNNNIACGADANEVTCVQSGNMYVNNKTVNYGGQNTSAFSACLQEAQTGFQNSTVMDDIGKQIDGNTLASADIIDLATYNTVTNYGNNLTYYDLYAQQESWLKNTTTDSRYGYILGNIAGGSDTPVSGTNNVYSIKFTNVYYSALNFTIPVNLPQKNYISNFSVTQTLAKTDYANTSNTTGNKSGTVIANVTTTGGEGPYRFYVYDSGNSITNSSKLFGTTMATSSNGSTSIKLSNKLSPGTYNFRIAVVDEKENNRLYLAPTVNGSNKNFMNDTLRLKESGVITFVVDKSNQPAISVNDTAVFVTGKTVFPVDATDGSITLYPKGGSTDIADTEFTYQIVSDPNGILSNTPAKGSSGNFTLSGNTGTASIKITKPGGTNYNDVSTTVQIVSTALTDVPVISGSDGTNAYLSNTKSNKDITLTFNKGANGSTVTKALKLKELIGVTNPAADWYKTSGTETTVTPGTTKLVNATSSRTYNLYWLYYDGYIDNGVEFRVDLLKDTPKVKNPVNTSNWLSNGDTFTSPGISIDLTTGNHTMDSTKTKLYKQGDTTTAYPLTNISEGLYTLHLVDEYGNEDDVDFKVSGNLHFENDSGATITNDEVYYGNNFLYTAHATGASSGITIKYRLKGTDNVLQTTSTANEFTIQDIGNEIIEAYTEDTSGNLLSSAQLNVTVKKAKQTVSFLDSDDPKNITYDPSNNTLSQTAKVTIDANMPNAGMSGEGTITYTISGKDASIATVDSNGNITISGTITSMKTFTLTADVLDSTHFDTTSAVKTINVYPEGSLQWTAEKPYAQAEVSPSNTKVGKISYSGGMGSVQFDISTQGTSDNIDANLFTIDTLGNVYLKKQLSASDLTSKVYNTSQKAYELKLVVTTTDSGETKELPITVYVTGAPYNGLDFANRDPLSKEITEVYGKNKTFQLSLNQMIQNVSYRISTNPQHTSPNDVITVDGSGEATILNANSISVNGSTRDPVYVEAVISANNGYAETVIEAPVRIKRADQTLTVAQDPINTDITIQSLNVAVNGHLDSEKLAYSINDNEIDVIADPSDSDTILIKPNGKHGNGFNISILAKGDRNYNQATKDVTLNISETPLSQFVAIFPNMRYGDTDLKEVTISGGESDSVITYTVKDQNIIEIDENGQITIHNAGITEVEVTKTDSNGTVGPIKYQVTVKPKNITVTVDDKDKYVGATVPEFTIQIPQADLVGNDTLGTPVLSSTDTTGKAVTEKTPAGVYDIKATFQNPNPNYNIKVENGKLTVTQDEGKQSWYHLEDKDGNVANEKDWYQERVDVVLDGGADTSAGTYNQIANNSSFTGAGSRFSVIDEGESTQDIYFRIDPNSGTANAGAISTSIQTKIHIDNTKPKIQSIVAQNKKSEKSRTLTRAQSNGKTYRPGVIVNITATDEAPKDNPDIEVSGIQNITYDIMKMDENKQPNTMVQSDDTVEVSLAEAGTYQVCAVSKDRAGNESAQKCETLTVRKWGESSDDKELPDINIDIDGDGIADINITRPGEKKPYLNIDTDGDGIPDINISRDGEEVIPGVTEPYLNIIDPKVDWNPTVEIDYDGDGEPDFRTDGSLSAILSIDSNGDKIPDLNIDTDHDYIADINIDVKGDHKSAQINIDTDGDGKPDINIDTNGDGKADAMISSDFEWNPIYLVKDKEGKVIYGTTSDIKPDTKDSLEDNGFILKPIDGSESFNANDRLKIIDITDQTSESEKASILKDYQEYEFAKLYEIQLWINNELSQPKGRVSLSIPCIKDSEDIILLMKQNGKYQIIEYEQSDSHYIITTDVLGEIAILRKPEHKTDVQGTYYKHSIGGADTGDTTSLTLSISFMLLSLGCICFIGHRLLKKN